MNFRQMFSSLTFKLTKLQLQFCSTERKFYLETESLRLQVRQFLVRQSLNKENDPTVARDLAGYIYS